MSGLAGTRNAAPVRVVPTRVEVAFTVLPRRLWVAAALVLGVIALPVADLLSVTVWKLDLERLAPLHYFATDPKDSIVFATAKARSAARHDADVLVLGNSSVREALIDDVGLQRLAGQRIVNLSSSAQHPLEGLFLLEQAPLRAGQVVALFTSVRMLGQDNPVERMRTGAYLVDTEPFLLRQGEAPESLHQRVIKGRQLVARALRKALPNRAREVLYGLAPPPAQPYFYAGLTPMSEAQRATLGARVVEHVQQRHEVGLLRLERAVAAVAAHCRRHGARLVVFEAPNRPDRSHGELAAWTDAYRAAITRAAGAPPLDPNPIAQLQLQEFYDISHLYAPPGRARFSRAFVNLLPRRG